MWSISGDSWLIDQFPMSTPTDDGELHIGRRDLARQLPLDRTIQHIQRYKRVYSARACIRCCAR